MVQESQEIQNAETMLSGYRLLRGLGRGNTSRVYLAEKTGVSEPGSVAAVRGGERVALKVPLPATLADQGAAERFANEVRLSLQFRHPRLVVGLDGTPFGPDTFLAMHHYPGGTLAQQLGVGPLGLSATLQVLSDVASGLAYLHRAGAVHQDVKTQNVYLETPEPEDGAAAGGLYRAALGDFGSTYFQSQGGQVSGSPFYMAPEVYQGEMTGPPSDVYSFGVLAYELLSGERPHLGDSYERLMISHLTHFPAQLNIEGLPRGLARLLDSALAKRPADRPASAALRRALLHSLGQPDEADPEQQEREAAETPLSRASVGRHGTVAAQVRPATFVQAGSRPAEALPTAPEKRGWNPFRKKK